MRGSARDFSIDVVMLVVMGPLVLGTIMDVLVNGSVNVESVISGLFFFGTLHFITLVLVYAASGLLARTIPAKDLSQRRQLGLDILRAFVVLVMPFLAMRLKGLPTFVVIAIGSAAILYALVRQRLP